MCNEEMAFMILAGLHDTHGATGASHAYFRIQDGYFITLWGQTGQKIGVSLLSSTEDWKHCTIG
jgi:hypothetical protein